MANEVLYARPYASDQAHREAIGMWVNYFNYHRPHTACGGQPPASRTPARINNVMTSYTYAAHNCWARSRARPKQAKLLAPGRLRNYVQARLLLRWSPQQIGNTLIEEFPEDRGMRVSTETVYQALYLQALGGLKREVAAALRTGRTRRNPHRDPQARSTRFVDEMVMISAQPPEINGSSQSRV